MPMTRDTAPCQLRTIPYFFVFLCLSSKRFDSCGWWITSLPAWKERQAKLTIKALWAFPERHVSLTGETQLELRRPDSTSSVSTSFDRRMITKYYSVDW
eukprot:CCRYP_008583-RB/>CCRYP_008583-RB protein AED:0.21 eAED:0.24 QI:0/0.5/0.66/1/0.5/0.33/3/4067/98